MSDIGAPKNGAETPKADARASVEVEQSSSTETDWKAEARKCEARAKFGS